MEPYQAVSYVSEANTKIPIADGVSEKSDNNKDSQRKKTSVCRSEKSVVKRGPRPGPESSVGVGPECSVVDNNKGGCDDHQPVEKKHILEELLIFQRLQKEHEDLCWERIRLESSPVKKERRKNGLENLKDVVAKFVREVVIDSAKQEKFTDLLDEVKAGNKMIKQKNFEAKRENEKLEKKQKQHAKKKKK